MGSDSVTAFRFKIVNFNRVWLRAFNNFNLNDDVSFF